MEMKPMRRIVTGHDAHGKAVALFDGSSTPKQRSPGGNAVTMLWVTGENPVDMTGNQDRASTPVGVPPPANGSISNNTSPTVSFSATNSPTSYTCKIDAAAAAACSAPSVSYSGLADGSHTVTVTATNAAGTGSAAVTFTVDATAPVVSISSPANGSTTSNSVTTNFTVTDASSTTTTCKLDAAAATSCTSGQVYSGLASGSHTITVTATDAVVGMAPAAALNRKTSGKVAKNPAVAHSGPQAAPIRAASVPA